MFKTGFSMLIKNALKWLYLLSLVFAIGCSKSRKIMIAMLDEWFALFVCPMQNDFDSLYLEHGVLPSARTSPFFSLASHYPSLNCTNIKRLKRWCGICGISFQPPAHSISIVNHPKCCYTSLSAFVEWQIISGELCRVGGSLSPVTCSFYDIHVAGNCLYRCVFVAWFL